jgi:hypothetical protein
VETDDQAKTLTRETSMAVAVGDVLEPCQPPGVLADILESTGRPCPRIELMIENATPWQLFSLVIREDARVMFGSLFAALTGGESRETQAKLVRRVLGTLNAPQVHEILHPPPRKK